MKVTVYTTPDCTFSKQEKEYLAAKGVTFEEKDVHTNRDFLTEMLSISNNFAGTPVTKIDKDDGQSVVLKGYTQQDFDNVLSVNVQTVNSTIPKPQTDQPQDVPAPTPPQPEPIIETPVQEPTPEPMPVETPPQPEPVVETPPPVEIPVETPPVETPVQEPTPEPVTPTTPQPPVEQSKPEQTVKKDDPLSSILDNLKTKSEEPTTQNSTPPTSIPNFQG